MMDVHEVVESLVHDGYVSPDSWCQDAVAAAIRAEVARAVAEEREAAAKIAELWEATGCDLPRKECVGCPAVTVECAWDGPCIAENIRARGTNEVER